MGEIHLLLLKPDVEEMFIQKALSEVKKQRQKKVKYSGGSVMIWAGLQSK